MDFAAHYIILTYIIAVIIVTINTYVIIASAQINSNSTLKSAAPRSPSHNNVIKNATLLPGPKITLMGPSKVNASQVIDEEEGHQNSTHALLGKGPGQ
jgi:hypothetical protein